MAKSITPEVQDLKSFESRLKRIDPDHKPTAWRKWRTRPRRGFHIPMLRFGMVLLFTYCTLTIAKIVMEQELGPAGFDARVERLANGNDTSKIAAKLLRRDAVMTYVRTKI